MDRDAWAAYPSTRNVGAGGLVAASALVLVGAAGIVHYRAKASEKAHPPSGEYVTSDAVRLHYIESGQGAPVVFLHGNGVTCEDFRVSGVFDAAAQRYHAFAFDRPGFGYSERPWGKSWAATSQAALLPKAFKLLGIHRPIVVGHSWGTMVALALALNDPDALSGLVLASGYYYPTARADVAIFSPPAIPILGRLVRHTVAPFIGEAMAPRLIKKMFAPQPVPSEFWTQVPISLMTRPSQIRAAAEDAAHMITSANTLSARYGELSCPVAILAGDADQVIDLEYHALRLHRDLPHSSIEVRRGSGHMLHHFSPDTIIRAIDEVAARG